MSSLPRATASSLRRLALSPSQRRALATQAAETPSPAEPSSSQPASASSSKSWSPAVKPGVSPAYDAALRYISDQSSRVKRRIAEAQSSQDVDAAEKEKLLDSLTIASEVNDPKLRWEFANAKEDALDMSKPTIRHLRERAWRKCGGLAKLSDRVRDQGVIPDSIPHITPTVDVQYILEDTAGPGVGDHADQTAASLSGDVLAGVLVEQRHLMNEPLLRLTAFHTQEKKYTMAMVDIDRPDEAGNLVSHVHWLITDIPLSAKSPRLSTAASKLGNEVLPYVPPYPAKGSERHRYVTLLFEQGEITPQTPSRQSFDLRSWADTNKLSPAGIHFFRSEWTEKSEKTISRVWRRMEENEEEWGRINRKERKRREPLTYRIANEDVGVLGVADLAESADVAADSADAADADLVADADGKVRAEV